MTRTTIEATLAEALRARRGRVTPQRLAIASTLGAMDRHVTAESLFAEVSRRMPGVSLPTVYSTLELLEELDLVRRVATVGGSVVYDPLVREHHHLVCRACGAIADVEAAVDDTALLAAARAAGFAPELAQVAVTGLCERCRAANPAAA